MVDGRTAVPGGGAYYDPDTGQRVDGPPALTEAEIAADAAQHALNERNARIRVGELLGLDVAPTWQDVLEFMTPVVRIKSAGSKVFDLNRLEAMRLARSTARQVVLDSDVPRQPAEIIAAVEKRALEMVPGRYEAQLSAEAKAIITAIVELIAGAR